MKNVFLTLWIFSTILLVTALVLGLSIDNPAANTPEARHSVNLHFLTAVGALIFASLLHAIVLTYFMGTGRWMEETSKVYQLSKERIEESRSSKYRLIVAMSVSLFLLILTGAFGAMADPATPAGNDGFMGVSIATIHFMVAMLTVGVNLCVNFLEYLTIKNNGVLIQKVMQEVLSIRKKKGLPVEA